MKSNRSSKYVCRLITTVQGSTREESSTKWKWNYNVHQKDKKYYQISETMTIRVSLAEKQGNYNRQ